MSSKRYSVMQHARRLVLLGIPLALLIAMLLGFLDFTNRVQTLAEPPATTNAQAIVALTGGTQGRLDVGLELLRTSRGERLLISGVNQDLSDAQLREGLQIEPDLASCCVDFGREALDTLGNATETAAWARKHGYTHLFVVTDDYHMPRSFIELRLAMPNSRLTPYPVKTAWADPESWVTDPAAAGRIGVEYAKFLFVSTRERIIHLLRSENADQEAKA
ncbi:MAG: YdcF family protein [Caulobacterales bacterium]|jgi:uncharacterized SAM-binding protein YcdF (DUF218 family)